jgi:hypothetical protein
LTFGFGGNLIFEIGFCFSGGGAGIFVTAVDTWTVKVCYVDIINLGWVSRGWLGVVCVFSYLKKIIFFIIFYKLILKLKKYFNLFLNKKYFKKTTYTYS